MAASSLFRAGRVYEIVSEIIAGDPMVIVPRNCLEQARLASDEEFEKQYLIGQRHFYRDVPIYDVDEIVNQVPPAIGPERILGVMQAIKAGGLSPDEVAIKSALGPGQAVVVVSLNAEPVAFVLNARRQLRRAGLMVYGVAQQEQHSSEPSSQPIEITWDDILGKGTAKPAQEPVSSAKRVGQLPFPEPVRCAYRGHRFTQLPMLCPDCGVPICRKCREEALGCITVGCSQSPCR